MEASSAEWRHSERSNGGCLVYITVKARYDICFEREEDIQKARLCKAFRSLDSPASGSITY